MMKIKLMTPVWAILLTLGLGAAEVLGAVAGVGFVNVSGIATNGGQTITIELKNAAGAVVGDAEYTTQAGDSDQHIADALKNDFVPTPGFGAKRVKDKADGTEVIRFKRKKNGGQDFEITITVVPGPSEITINEKGTYSAVRSCTVVPPNTGYGAGTAVVDVVGQGTEWMTGTFAVTALHFADDITVNSFQILSDTMINADISWSPGSALPGGVHVDVIGDYLDDLGMPLTDIVHDVSSDPFVLLASAIPTVSEWGLIVMTLLVLTAGTIILGRRHRPATA